MSGHVLALLGLTDGSFLLVNEAYVV